jgi:hypothetical protein
MVSDQTASFCLEAPGRVVMLHALPLTQWQLGLGIFKNCFQNMDFQWDVSLIGSFLSDLLVVMLRA